MKFQKRVVSAFCSFWMVMVAPVTWGSNDEKQTGIVGIVSQEVVEDTLLVQTEWGAARVLWDLLSVPVENESSFRRKRGNQLTCHEWDDVDPLKQAIQRHRCWFAIKRGDGFISPSIRTLPRSLENPELNSAWESWKMKQSGDRTVFLKFRHQPAKAILEMGLSSEQAFCGIYRQRMMTRSGPSGQSRSVLQCRIRFTPEGTVVPYEAKQGV